MSNDEIQKENKPKIKMSICVNFLNSWPESLDWKYHTWKKPQTQSLTNQNWRIPQSYLKKISHNEIRKENKL